MQPRNDERAQEDQGRPEPAQTGAHEVHTERADEDQDRAHEHDEPRDVHTPAVTPPDAILGPQRANGGACRCQPVPADQWPRELDCTCIWSEVLAAIRHLAYGEVSDDDIIAFAPVLATMAHDAAYRARDEALSRRLADWPGTRTAFARHYDLHRSRLYQLGLTS